MTTRRWMIAVAVAGIVLAGFRLWRLRIEYGQQAALHGAHETACRDRAVWAARMARKGYTSRREEVVSRARADYHGRLKGIYEHAAAHPWLPLARDPPEPR